MHQKQDAKAHLFNCSVYDDSFYTTDDLDGHPNEEERYEDEFPCQHCDRSFPAKDRLQQHHNNSHRQNNRGRERSVADNGIITSARRCQRPCMQLSCMWWVILHISWTRWSSRRQRPHILHGCNGWVIELFLLKMPFDSIGLPEIIREQPSVRTLKRYSVWTSE